MHTYPKNLTGVVLSSSSLHKRMRGTSHRYMLILIQITINILKSIKISHPDTKNSRRLLAFLNYLYFSYLLLSPFFPFVPHMYIVFRIQ